MRAPVAALAMALMTGPSGAETVSLYAAGSLRGALTDIASAYAATGPDTIEAKFGPSGTLKDEIAGGARADVFASANMAHPQALHDAGKGGPVMLFARNRLCALAPADFKVTTGTLLERMLDTDVRLGTSTPKADPSGDYAFEVFRKAEAVRPGAQAALEKKALQLTGGAASAQPPAGRNAYGWHVAEGRADIFLTYCTNAVVAVKENPDQKVVALPQTLAVGADYGLTVIKGAGPAADRFAKFIISPQGEAILKQHGFSAGTSP